MFRPLYVNNIIGDSVGYLITWWKMRKYQVEKMNSGKIKGIGNGAKSRTGCPTSLILLLVKALI